MNDFETHPVGYVAHLKQKIFELEQGACRFNCRTRKEAFMAGFDAGFNDTDEQDRYFGLVDGDMEQAYKEWCEQKD